MAQTKQIKRYASSNLNNSTILKSNSAFSISPSRSSQYYIKNQQIKRKAQKLNIISQSVDISALAKNPLNMIQYEMQGQKSRHDPQMILAKLRKLQNRAQLHRANIQINQLDQQRQKQHNRPKKHHTFRLTQTQRRKQEKLNYIKIYKSYLKQKQIQEQQRQRYEDDDYGYSKDQQDLNQVQNGIKYIQVLRKHPRLLDLTKSRKKAKQGITQIQIKTQRKSNLTTAIKKKLLNQDYEQQKQIQKQKQQQKYIQNPQKVIQRQLTKFYIKKNPGKLSYDAQNNQRSIELIKRQNKISYEIDQNRISKEDKRKMRSRFNQLANQLAKSDRRKSLQGILPRLKQQNVLQNIQKQIKRKLFSNNQ